jgi:hypothetical protein
MFYTTPKGFCSMNTGAKVMVGIGAFMLIGGILATIMGFGSVVEADGWGPTDDVYFEVTGSDSRDGLGVFTHVEDGNGSALHVFVSDEVRCDDFTLQIEGGEAKWMANYCIEDGKLPMGYVDDPEGWLHLGSIIDLEDSIEYEFEVSHDVVLVSSDVINEIIGSFFAGLAGICGGPTFLCCGLFFLVIGIVMAITQKDTQKTETKIVINQEIEAGSESTKFSYDKQEEPFN